MTRIAEIKKRLGEATPGPWAKGEAPHMLGHYVHWVEGSATGHLADMYCVEGHARHQNAPRNATFIANAPSDIEYLLSENAALLKCAQDGDSAIVSLEATNTRLREALEAIFDDATQRSALKVAHIARKALEAEQ